MAYGHKLFFYGHETCSMVIEQVAGNKFWDPGSCSIVVIHVLWPENMFYSHRACSTVMEQVLGPKYMCYGHRTCSMATEHVLWPQNNSLWPSNM